MKRPGKQTLVLRGSDLVDLPDECNRAENERVVDAGQHIGEPQLPAGCAAKQCERQRCTGGKILVDDTGLGSAPTTMRRAPVVFVRRSNGS